MTSILFYSLNKFSDYNSKHKIVHFNLPFNDRLQLYNSNDPFIVPPIPQNVSVKRINQTAMSVTWIPIDITIARGIILHYTITYFAQRLTRQNNMNSVTVPANQSGVIINDLQAGVTYTVTVNAASRVGEGNKSKPFDLAPPKGMLSNIMLCSS